MRLKRDARNAFDIIRLVLATLVVLEHSYFLVEDTTAKDPLSILSCGQMNFGQFAVYLFFALSGFLVTNSLCESSSTRVLSLRGSRVSFQDSLWRRRSAG